MKSAFTRFTLAASLFTGVALCGAQSSNTIAAKFASAPGAGSSFSVSLVNRGAATSVAGFAFKLQYDPAQVSIAGTVDNTNQPDAGMQYTMGPETAAESGNLPAERIISGTTAKELTNANNLVEIKFAKKAGFTAPFKFNVVDRLTTPVVDGLQGADLKNIPHGFDVSEVNK